MTPPNELVIDGVRYVQADRAATHVRTHFMYDCHLFHHSDARSIDELVKLWQAECEKPDKRYGPPMLCPVIVMEGEKEVRRVGHMVFPKTPYSECDLGSWLDPVRRDPDIERLLGERGTANGGV
jgi:hypothetical protein